MDVLASQIAWYTAQVMWLSLAVFAVRGLDTRPTRELVAVVCASFLTALALRYGLVWSYQRLYTDEALYVSAAAQLADHGHVAGLNHHKAYGWPALLALPMAWFGASNAVALHTSTLIAGLTAPLAALLAWGQTQRWQAAAWASGLVALWPLHGLWSRTTEANAAGSALLLWAALWLWTHHRRPGLLHGVLAIVSLAVACNVRPEAWVLGGLALATSSQRRAVLAGLALATPNLLAYGRVHLHTNLNRAEGLGWDAAATHPFMEAWTGPLQPLGWRVVVASGVLLACWAQPRRALWGLSWVIGTLAFLGLAGTGALTEPARFVLAAGAPACVLAAIGLDALNQRLGPKTGYVGVLIALGVSLSAVEGWEHATRLRPGYLLQQDLLDQARPHLRDGCILVAAMPDLYADLAGRPVIHPDDYRAHDHGPCADAIWDFPCFEWGHPPFRDACDAIVAWGVDPVRTFTLPPTLDSAGRHARLYHLPEGHLGLIEAAPLGQRRTPYGGPVEGPSP